MSSVSLAMTGAEVPAAFTIVAVLVMFAASSVVVTGAAVASSVEFLSNPATPPLIAEEILAMSRASALRESRVSSQ